MVKLYEVLISVEDSSASDAEDLEEILTQLFDGYLPEGLPSDLKAQIIEINEAPDENI